MSLRTLSQLKIDTLWRSDLYADSNVISDPELRSYINSGFAELMDLIIQADKGTTFTKVAGELTQTGDHEFVLPADTYRIVAVHSHQYGSYLQGSSADPAVLANLNNFKQFTVGNPLYYYRWNPVSGIRTLYIWPTPQPKDLAVTYFPQPFEMVEDDDAVDNPAFWLDYVSVTAAIKCLAKIERDPSQLQLEKKELTARIKKAVTSFDMSPNKIRRVSTPEYRYNRNGWGGIGTVGY
jgi:hypothetical protein